MAGKDININSEIVLSIADRMDESCRVLKRLTDGFARDWNTINNSFDDTSKREIEQVIINATVQIDDVIKNQQASILMRKYVDTLRGNNR